MEGGGGMFKGQPESEVWDRVVGNGEELEAAQFIPLVKNTT